MANCVLISSDPQKKLCGILEGKTLNIGRNHPLQMHHKSAPLKRIDIGWVLAKLIFIMFTLMAEKKPDKHCRSIITLMQPTLKNIDFSLNYCCSFFDNLSVFYFQILHSCY